VPQTKPDEIVCAQLASDLVGVDHDRADLARVVPLEAPAEARVSRQAPHSGDDDVDHLRRGGRVHRSKELVQADEVPVSVSQACPPDPHHRLRRVGGRPGSVSAHASIAE
jgi:hypothetical protein